MTRSFAWLLALLLAGCASGGPARAPAGMVPERVRVAVVRHAEAFKNLTPPPTDVPEGQLDSLTKHGVEQAHQLAERLAGVEAKLVATSPAGRARGTAEVIARELGLPPPRVDARLAPLAGGTTPSGEAADHAWREAAWARGEDPTPAGGESLEEGVAAARALIAELATEMGGGPLIVVTHGDIAAGLIGDAAGTAIPERWARHEIPTGSSQTIELQLGQAPR